MFTTKDTKELRELGIGFFFVFFVRFVVKNRPEHTPFQAQPFRV